MMDLRIVEWAIASSWEIAGMIGVDMIFDLEVNEYLPTLYCPGEIAIMI